MFVDLDWPLNASSLLSASAELLIFSVLYFLWSGWSAFAVSPSRLSLSLLMIYSTGHAGSLHYAGVDGKPGSNFTIMVYQMLTIREEIDYPVVELVIYTKISGLVQKAVSNGIRCLWKIQGNEVNIVNNSYIAPVDDADRPTKNCNLSWGVVITPNSVAI